MTLFSPGQCVSLPLGLAMKKYRLAILLVVLSLTISFQMSWGADTKQASPVAEGVEALPFDKVAPLPGALAISADGRIAAHINMEGDVVIWDVARLKTLETIASSDQKASAVALSPDGNLIAIGYFGGRLMVRSRPEKKPLREFYGHSGRISALAFSPDGQMLASGAGDATTQLWEIATGKRLHVFDSMFDEHELGVPVSVGFSGDGQALIVNDWHRGRFAVGRSITIWDTKDGIEISTRDVAPPNHDEIVRTGQALGSKGWLLTYTGGWLSDKVGLMVERLDQCEPPRQLPSGGYANTVAADPLGRWVAATENEYMGEMRSEKITFFGTNNDQKSYAISLPENTTVIALVPSPDGHSVLTIADTQFVDTAYINQYDILFNNAETVTGSVLYRIPVPEPLWHSPPLNVKKDATHCAPIEATRNFKLPEKPLELTVIEGATNFITEKRLSSVLSYESAQDTALSNKSDPDTGQFFRRTETYIEHYDAIGHRLSNIATKGIVLDYAVRNGRLAALYKDGNVQVWQLIPDGESKIYKPGLSLDRGYMEEGVDALALSADGRYLYAVFPGPGDAPTDYTIYRLSSGEAVGSGPLLAPFPARANRGVVYDTRPHRLAVWDYDKGEIIARLPRQRSRNENGEYWGLLTTLSDDGRLLASASYDGLVRVWDIDAHRLLGEGRAGSEVTALAFDATGERLAAGRKDGQIIVFQIPAPE